MHNSNLLAACKFLECRKDGDVDVCIIVHAAHGMISRLTVLDVSLE